MWLRLIVAALVLCLCACAQTPPQGSASSESAATKSTPAGPAPAQASDALNRIQTWLLSSISRMPDDSFLRNGIAPAEVGRAKSCVVQAIVSDIPEEPAKHIAMLLDHDPPLKDEVVEKWVLSGLEKHGERRQQVMARVETLCPEFVDSFSS